MGEGRAENQKKPSVVPAGDEPKPPGKIAVLMCTYNSGRYLREQMESIFAQSHGNWELWVSDDGSTDNTAAILDEYRNRGKRVEIVAGPQQGCARNFLSLTARLEIAADYFAWADSDDIWLPGKLGRALAHLEKTPPGSPALYGARTRLVDGENREFGFSPRSKPYPEFRHVLAQNFAGGNTMVFNAAARELLCEAELPDVFMHDWWLAILVAGVGGLLVYDSLPCLRYRQHGGNVTGAGCDLVSRAGKFSRAAGGALRERNALHIAALAKRRHLLTEENRRRFDCFVAAHREPKFLKRLRLFLKSGVRRQSPMENMALATLFLLHKYP